MCVHIMVYEITEDKLKEVRGGFKVQSWKCLNLTENSDLKI